MPYGPPLWGTVSYSIHPLGVFPSLPILYYIKILKKKQYKAGVKQPEGNRRLTTGYKAGGVMLNKL
jgi:hypothetical protein